MSTLTQRWFAFVQVEDRSGASAAIAGVFSERGVSFGSISTLDVHGGVGTMCVEFGASERLAHVLVRTLERLAVVRSVDLVHADDARVRAVAVLAAVGEEIGAPAGVSVHRDGLEGTVLLTGPLTAVASTVASLRAGDATVEAFTVLPPR
ncbi:hypothetical protein [Demequina iriomotensis]|uniref:hypothetical protein n=1 Tax=Demequina iriomotensis TaxID=1536641 RepID=UPI000785591A|nr:hypothetical protein [Demequina iriomotensis]